MANEGGQHFSTHNGDIPEEPLPHHKPPDEPTKPEEQPPSLKLEGEYIPSVSVKVAHTTARTMLTATSDGDDDPRN